MWSRWCVAALGLFLATGTCAAEDLSQWQDGSDLESFVSRPDIKAPRMLVAKHRPEQITDGHWFMTPYSHFDDQPSTKRKEFNPCQTGAHIYDSEGVLVWSGACWGGNRNIFGFRPVVVNGKQYMTLFEPGRVLGDNLTPEDRNRSGVILDDKYQEVSRIHMQGDRWLDFHEFYLQPDGKSALVTTMREVERLAPELGQGKRKLLASGFRELEIPSGKRLFEWNPLEAGVLLNESCDARGRSANHSKYNWDYLHINAVDKNPDGDYFVSARHTSTIYKVSGRGGHILWRLGGYKSDFVMDSGAEFTWQHDVRFHSQNSTHTIISVFDNTGEDEKRNPEMKTGRSAAKVLALDTASRPMRATVMRRIARPDGQFSPKLGNVQLLGKDIERDNLFVNWAIQGYVSEHNAAGDTLFEARFQSKRMSSYRAFKAPFAGDPQEPPRLKAVPMRFNASVAATGLYVSWNGATKVAAWVFYGREDVAGNFEMLGNPVPSMGFETSYVLPHLVRHAYAEALDEHGNFLGRSPVDTIDPPTDGGYAAFSFLTAEKTFTPSIAMGPIILKKPTVSLSSWMYTLTVNGLAAWGFYCILRRFTTREVRRRQGYKALI